MFQRTDKTDRKFPCNEIFDPSRLKFVSLSINLKKVERNEKSHSSDALEPTNPRSTLKKRKTEALTRLLLPPFTISLREKKATFWNLPTSCFSHANLQ